MHTHARVKAAVDNYEINTGKRPEYLILDSFIHERLKVEAKESLDDMIGDLKNIYGITVVLLRNSLVVS